MTDKIKKKIETSEKHKSMKCVAYEIKLKSNAMSKLQKTLLTTLFREAKWFKNYIVSLDSVYDADDKIKRVKVFKGKEITEEELTLLSSQMRQGLIGEYKTCTKSMSTNKKKGNASKNGKFRYKSVCNEIPLKQFGNTYQIDFSRNRISIAKIKGEFKCYDLNQIPPNADICNAQLIRKPSGFYLHIICYIEPKSKKTKNHKIKNMIGIDFGIEHNLTTSDGEIIDVKILETKSVKLFSKKLNKAFSKNYKAKCKKLGKSKLNKEERNELKHFANHFKRRIKLQRAYEKQTNKKKDFANKIVSNLLKENDLIVIQDELISKWHSGLFGKQVQISCMGTIKMELKQSPKVLVIESAFPSTQLCPKCGEKTKHDLSKREYHCGHCGYHHINRDVKSAETLLAEGIKRLNNQSSLSGTESCKSLVEPVSSTNSKSCKRKRFSKKSAMKQEAIML